MDRESLMRMLKHQATTPKQCAEAEEVANRQREVELVQSIYTILGSDTLCLADVTITTSEIQGPRTLIMKNRQDDNQPGHVLRLFDLGETILVQSVQHSKTVASPATPGRLKFVLPANKEVGLRKSLGDALRKLAVDPLRREELGIISVTLVAYSKETMEWAIHRG